MSIASAVARRLPETAAVAEFTIAALRRFAIAFYRCYSRPAPLALAGLLALLAGPAAAGSLVPYTPGGSPCAGACSYEWAIEQTGAPTGEPQRLVVPAGMTSRWMSYARDGEPRVDSRPLKLMSEQPGEGYWFRRDGELLLMVKLDVCQNWAIMAPAPEPITPEDAGLGLPGPGRLATAPPPGRLAAASGGGGGGGAGGGGGSPWIAPLAVPFALSASGGGSQPPGEEPPETPAPPTSPPTTPPGVTPPTPVPLPSGGWLLLAGLAALLGAGPALGRAGGRGAGRTG